MLVLEDVAYGEPSFENGARRACASLAPEIVVQAGTFSKTFFPGVRLGWAAGPAEVVAKLVWAKQNTDQCAGALGQRLLEEYGRRGHLDEGLGRARGLDGARRDAIMAALDRHVGDRASWTRPQGGFFTWLDLSPAATRSPRRGARSRPGSPSSPARPSSRQEAGSTTSGSRSAAPTRRRSTRASAASAGCSAA